MRTLCALLTASIACITAGHAAEPTLKWSYEALSTLYAPPLTADMHPAPGLETILSDSEARVLRCIGANGKQLWECAPGWTKRLTASAALSNADAHGRRLLAICGSDGLLCCIAPGTGEILWTRQARPMTWGSVVWTDLDHDGTEELAVGMDEEIQALEADGEMKWRFEGGAGKWKLQLQGAISAGDVDGDGFAEIFGASRWGPFCLGQSAKVLWYAPPPGAPEFCASVALGDVDRNDIPELYCASKDEDALWCFDARRGDVRWRCPLLAPVDVYANSTFAAADLDGDGAAEVLAGDSQGHVRAVKSEILRANSCL